MNRYRNLRKKIALLLSILLLFGICLTGCATYDNFRSTFILKKGQTDKTVRIGVFEPLSGVDKKYGELEKRGIELAHSLYPTVLGKEVELIYGDNKSDLFAAESVAKEMASRKPAVVLGSYGNALSLMGVDTFKEHKIPSIAITCTNPLVTNSSNFAFRVSYIESFQGTAAAKYAVEVCKASTAAIMKESGDDFDTEIVNVFKNKFKSLTSENSIVSETEYTSGSEEFNKQLKSIADSGAQVVFIPGEAEEAAKIMKEAKHQNLRAEIIGTDEWETEDFVELGGDAVEGAAFTSLLDIQAHVNVTRDIFLKAYKRTYGSDATPEAAEMLGFDAYLIAIESIEKAESTNGEEVREAMRKTRNFAGSSGNISFDPNGDPVKSVFIKEIQNGEFQYIYTSEPTWN